MRTTHLLRGMPVLIVLVAFLSCQESKQFTQAERVQVKHEIRAMLDSVSQSVQMNGLVGFIPFLDQSPEFQSTYRNRKVNYETLAMGIRADSERYRSVTIQWDSVVVEPLSSERAAISTYYTERLVDTTGKASSLSGTFRGELARVAQGWKFHSMVSDSAQGTYPASAL